MNFPTELFVIIFHVKLHGPVQHAVKPKAAHGAVGFITSTRKFPVFFVFDIGSSVCVPTYMSCGGVKWKHVVHFRDRFTNQPTTGLPTGLYSRNLNYGDDMQLPYVDIKDYVSKAVSGTKVNIVDVFNYGFPTICMAILIHTM